MKNPLSLCQATFSLLCLGFLGPLFFPMNFRISLLNSVGDFIKAFIEIVLNQYINLGKMCHFYRIIVCLYLFRYFLYPSMKFYN